MKDLSRKTRRLRESTAQAVLRLSHESAVRLSEDATLAEARAVARVAAVQAVRLTAQLLPLRHAPEIEAIDVQCRVVEEGIEVEVALRAIHKTGIEHETLAAATLAALALHDQLAIEESAPEITVARIIPKKTGKPKEERRDVYVKPPRAAVLVLSDSISAGKKEDSSGRLIEERLREHGVEIADYRVLPDDRDGIIAALRAYADEQLLDLVVTTGGTGFSPRDQVPEAMSDVIEREAPGVAEAARAFGQERTPFSMLSRGRCGIRGRTLIVNLPGSRRGVEESLDALLPGLLHAFKMIRGGGH